MAIQRITPFLWFDGKAEEAASFYVSIFPNSQVTRIARCGDGGPGPVGSALTVEFKLDGQTFVALNGGPMYKFTEAVSFVVNCASQEEIDFYWDRLTAGGADVQCGWLKDRYGLSWQIVPTALWSLLSGPDSPKSGRVLQALMTMKKPDLAQLEQA